MYEGSHQDRDAKIALFAISICEEIALRSYDTVLKGADPNPVRSFHHHQPRLHPFHSVSLRAVQASRPRSQTLGRCRSVHSQYSWTICSSRTTSGLPPAIVVLHQLWGVAYRAQDKQQDRHSQLVSCGDERQEEACPDGPDILHGELPLVRVAEGEVLS